MLHVALNDMCSSADDLFRQSDLGPLVACLDSVC